jgi:hypothetical protein
MLLSAAARRLPPMGRTARVTPAAQASEDAVTAHAEPAFADISPARRTTTSARDDGATGDARTPDSDVAKEPETPPAAAPPTTAEILLSRRRRRK